MDFHHIVTAHSGQTKNDTAARIGVFTTDNWQLEKMLRLGYLKVSDYVNAGERMVNIFTALPWLKPFDMLGTDDERNRIATLFSEENGHIISEYFSRRAKIGQTVCGTGDTGLCALYAYRLHSTKHRRICQAP